MNMCFDKYINLNPFSGKKNKKIDSGDILEITQPPTVILQAFIWFYKSVK